MPKHAKEVTVAIVPRHNTARQGEHIVLRAQGIPQREYKLRADVPVDAFVAYYTDRYINHKTVALNSYLVAFGKNPGKRQRKNLVGYRSAAAYLRKIRKQPNFLSFIKQGVRTSTIANPESVSTAELHERKKELFKGLVLDNKLRDLLAREENLKKLAYRLEYRVDFFSGETKVVSATKFGVTPEKIISDLKELGAVGTEHDGTKSYEFLKRLENKGFINRSSFGTGTIDRYTVTMIFRRG